MHRISFILKQHTPIIHFQNEQDGATLRASELKPKLDKFIIKSFEKAGKVIPRNWQATKSPDSLDYKLRIEFVASEKKEIAKRSKENKIDISPMFFGTIGDNYVTNPKSLVYYPNDIQISFVVKLADLSHAIKDLVPSFIAQTNFGTRQSKGYGSFWLTTGNVYPQYHFTLDDCRDWMTAMKKINIFYKAIRSGIHDGDFDTSTNTFTTKYYFKSLLFKYFNAKNYKWDKRAIKEDIILKSHPDVIKSQQEDYYNSDDSFDSTRHYQKEKFLARDMLGLSTDQDWLTYKSKIVKKFLPENKEDKRDITRFSSPIYFKPFFDRDDNQWIIYFDYNEIDLDYFNAPFKVSDTKHGNETVLKTPTAEIFTMKQYFDFLFKPGTDSSFTDIDAPGFEDHPTTEFLQNIFTEIRDNIKNNG